MKCDTRNFYMPGVARGMSSNRFLSSQFFLLLPLSLTPLFKVFVFSQIKFHRTPRVPWVLFLRVLYVPLSHYLGSLYGFLIWVPYLGSLFGFLIRVPKLGSSFRLLIQVPHSGSLFRFLIWVIHFGFLIKVTYGSYGKAYVVLLLKWIEDVVLET